MRKRLLCFVMAVTLLLGLAGCAGKKPAAESTGPDISTAYYSKEEVAAYIHEYDRLPVNYLTKSEAYKLGWDADKGNLWEVTDKGCIGGDVFGNREKLLPEAEERIYYECDVDYSGGYRNSHRLIYSSDGLIYYTEDHYSSFTQLY